MRNGTTTEINLILIRHGETASNREKRYLGRGDEGLSEQGKEALRQIADQGRFAPAELVYVSPMLRCRQTAQLLFPRAIQHVIPDWREMDFGAFEGKNYLELKDHADYQRWIDSGGTLPFPQGESREEFVERVRKAFDQLLCQLLAGQEKERLSITAVVHGGTIMALCSSLFGGEYFDYQIKCGQGYDCRLRHDSGNTWGLEWSKRC